VKKCIVILVIGLLLLFIGCLPVKNTDAAVVQMNPSVGISLVPSAPIPSQNSAAPSSSKNSSVVNSAALSSSPTPVATSIPIPIENASAETQDSKKSNMPASWSHDHWGNHKAAFTYLNEGYFDSRSMKIEITKYKSGDAKWFFNPVKLLPGDYMFCDYYRSNVDTRVIAVVTTNSGKIQYIDLQNAPASEDWVKYEAEFAMPKNGKSVTLYHMLTRDGYLITDDYSIKPYTYTGFNRGLVTLTFDDGWEDNYKTALPLLKELGFKSNQFYATTYIQHPSVSDPKELIRQFMDAGHEIESHSITHPDLTTLSSEQLTAELSESKSFLEKYLGVSIQYFATPFGSYNTFVNENVMKYYTAHRTVDAGYNSKDNLDLSRLKVQNILFSTTSEEVAEWVKKAKKEKLWLILLYHRVANDPGTYDTTPELFAEHMRVIKNASIPVVTFSEAFAELINQ